MPFQSFHISSQFSPNWSSGFLVPVGLGWCFPSAYAFHVADGCASSSLQLQNYSWNRPMHKDCPSDLHTDSNAWGWNTQMCIAWCVPWGQAPTPASSTSWVSRQSHEAPWVQAQRSLFLHPPWQISRAKKDTTDQDLIPSAAAGNLLVQNTGNKPSTCWVFWFFFLTFSYHKENELVMYPTVFSLVSSSRTESFARNFSARSTYWLLTFSGTGWQVWYRIWMVANWLFQRKGKIR